MDPRPNVAMGALAALLLPVALMIFDLVQGRAVDAAALAAGTVAILGYILKYHAPAFEKTTWALISGILATLLTGVLAYLQNRFLGTSIPIDIAAILAALCVAADIAFTAAFPNTKGG